MTQEFDWIIIADTTDGSLYWYGKNSLFPVHLPSGRAWDEVNDPGIMEMVEAMTTPRKRLVIINKKRYHVVSRGYFYEP